MSVQLSPCVANSTRRLNVYAYITPVVYVNLWLDCSNDFSECVGSVSRCHNTCFNVVDPCQKCTRVTSRHNSGAFFDTRQLGLSTGMSKNAPEFTGRQLGPWTRAVNSDSGNWALPYILVVSHKAPPVYITRLEIFSAKAYTEISRLPYVASCFRQTRSPPNLSWNYWIKTFIF